MADVERFHVVSFKKQELNNFLTCCGASPVREVDMGSSATTERTRRGNISEASGVMVAVLQTLPPSHPGELWKDLRDSDKICEALNVTNRTKLNETAAKESDMKYLIALSSPGHRQFCLYDDIIKMASWHNSRELISTPKFCPSILSTAFWSYVLSSKRTFEVGKIFFSQNKKYCRVL